MRAVMASCTIDVAMLLGLAIKRLILLVGAAVTGGIVTARLVKPRLGIFGDILHGSMAVDAVHTMVGGHDITQALGLWPGVTLVTPVYGRRYLVVMLLMDGMR